MNRKTPPSDPWRLLRHRRGTPLIRQTENAECGLACIAMILGHHGDHVSLFDLRSRHDISSRGASLNDLIAVAQSHGLHCRALRLELEEIRQLKTPCVLHWRMDHFVVLVQVSKKHVVIHDPAEGRNRFSLQDASRYFTGIALEAQPGETFTTSPKSASLPWSAVTRMLKGCGPALRAIFGFSIALEIFALLMPQLVQTVVDQVLTNHDQDLLTLVGISFVLLTLVQSSIAACRSWSVSWLKAQGAMRWTGVIHSHLLRLQHGYFERRHVGDVVSRVDAVHSIQNTLTSQMIGAFMDGIVGFATLIFLVVYSPLLAGIVFASVLIYCGLRAAVYGKARDISLSQVKAQATQRSDLIESLRGIQSIRINNKIAIRCASHANKTAHMLNYGMDSDRIGILFDTLSGVLAGLQRVTVLCIGAYFAMKSQMTAGMLMAFSAYADQFSTRSNKLIDYVIQLRLLGVQADRVADIVLSPEERHLDGTYQGPSPAASVSFRNISYRYSATSPWILRDASLDIPEGECIAIVGASGAGKSTALRLILGLVDPDEGDVLVGGVSLSRLGKSRFRESIGAVLQDDQLFAGTIAENICFHDTSANVEDIYEAARIAEIHDDICAMPMGYRTLVGDMGTSLSGGQKQRVVLARAMYRKPRILVLDEATSHLDLDLEKRIADRLKAMRMTRITVAHRPETIAAADRILSLRDGGFQEQP